MDDNQYSQIAVLGGTTFELAGPFGEGLVEKVGVSVTETPAGTSPPVEQLRFEGVPFHYVRFHGYSETDRADRISGANFVRMFAALRQLGVRYAFGGATSGGIRAEYGVGDFVIPRDLLDFNKERPSSFWEAVGLERPPIRARFNPPFCSYLSGLLERIVAEREPERRLHTGAVLVQSQPNRYETPAEIRMYRALGGDMVTHNVGTEAIYARQVGMHFAALQSISNPAEGVRPFTIEEEMEDGARISRRAAPIVLQAVRRVDEAARDCGIGCTGELFEGVVS